MTKIAQVLAGEMTRRQESGHLASCGEGGQEERDRGTGRCARGSDARLDECDRVTGCTAEISERGRLVCGSREVSSCAIVAMSTHRQDSKNSSLIACWSAIADWNSGCHRRHGNGNLCRTCWLNVGNVGRNQEVESWVVENEDLPFLE